MARNRSDPAAWRDSKAPLQARPHSLIRTSFLVDERMLVCRLLGMVSHSPSLHDPLPGEQLLSREAMSGV